MAKDNGRLIGQGEPVSADGNDEVDPREILRAVWRRKLILIATILVVTGAVYAYVSSLTPQYRGEALVRVNVPETQAVTIPGITAEFAADPGTLNTELQTLRSRTFARRMIHELDLDADEEFNWTLRPIEAPFWESWGLDRFIPSALARLFENGDFEDLARHEAMAGVSEDQLMNSLIGNFLSRLEVEYVPGSYIISVGFMSEDPAKAARIANAVAENYLSWQLERRYDAQSQATAWLQERIEELRAKVLEAEAKIADYRAENRLADGDRANSVTMQLAQINTQLAMAQAQRAEADARYSQVRGLLSSSGGMETASKVVTSPLMADLRAQETQLQRQLAELGSIYGDRHPQMVNVQAELRSVRDKMGEEVQRIAQDLQNDVAVARAREQQLQRSLGGLEGESAGQERAEVQLRDLVREAETNREMFQTFLQRYHQIAESQELAQPDAQILARADVPDFPAAPRKRLFMIAALGVSMMLGGFLVFVAERWDSGFGFRSADEVLETTGLKALALVPDLTRRDVQGVPAEEYILHKPGSAFGESLHRIRTGLFLADTAQPPKTILITSSVPLEGKSLIASSLARQSARSGLKVLLVDGDLRRPRLHEVVRVANQNGLTDLLSGHVSREDAIRTDDKSGMDFLPAGGGNSSPPDLMRSEAMKTFLREASERYDLVIIDSPPVAAVSDSFVLAGQVDKTVYVVRWERTPRKVAVSGLRQMLDAGADLAGVVISRVNVKKHARYGYADSGYYSGYYRKYYSN